MLVLSLKRSLIVALLGCCSLAIVIVGAHLIRKSIIEPPFLLIIQPEGDHAVVQFSQPGPGLVSKPFPINLQSNERREIVLDSDEVSIPGGQIEFADTTILPGRFKVRFGNTLFDVMRRGIEVDGQLFDWANPESHGASKASTP